MKHYIVDDLIFDCIVLRTARTFASQRIDDKIRMIGKSMMSSQVRAEATATRMLNIYPNILIRPWQYTANMSMRYSHYSSTARPTDMPASWRRPQSLVNNKKTFVFVGLYDVFLPSNSPAKGYVRTKIRLLFEKLKTMQDYSRRRERTSNNEVMFTLLQRTKTSDTGRTRPQEALFLHVSPMCTP